MLRSINDLGGLTIRATDGEIGSVDGFFFDDAHWAIRSMLVKTGGWLLPETVLISPQSIQAVHWEQRLIAVNLTCQQVRDAPNATTHQPVSRQMEIAHASYYGYEPYWYGPGLWGGMGMPYYSVGMAAYVPLGMGATERARVRAVEHDLPQGDAHLRSTREVMGYHIQASDGAIGHIKDFVMDDTTWALRYLVVDTQNWWPGKQVLVAPTWITAVNWDDRTVGVDLPRATIKAGPEYDPSQLNRAY
ncbi:MAG: PRC-barrel domain containing protein, partial [Chloroflexales bacterium]|nr:PRC-barrel domain containing protein [Chloroflexales bacterium]